MELIILPTLPGPGENTVPRPQNQAICHGDALTNIPAGTHPPKKKKEMGHAYSKGSGHFPQPQGRGAETKTGWVPAANSSLSQQRVSVRVLLSQKKSRRFQVVTSHRQSKHPPDVHPALSQPLART